MKVEALADDNNKLEKNPVKNVFFFKTSNSHETYIGLVFLSRKTTE